MTTPARPFRDGPLSLTAPAAFTAAGRDYTSLEHYLLDEFLQLLLLTRPADAPRLAETAAGTPADVWDDRARDILTEAVLARVQQDDARAALLATRGHLPAYCDPADAVWGTGIAPDHADAADPSRWPGRNWLGEVLADVRDRLLARQADEAPAAPPPAAATGDVVVWEANASDWRAFVGLARRKGWWKVLHVSDEPARPAFAEQAACADVVLATGDLDDRIETATCPVFYVHGNHDNPDELAARFLARPEAVLHGGVSVWEGLRLGGVGGCLPYKSCAAGQFTERDYEKALAGRGELDVFLTHTPPPWADKDDGVHGCPEAVADYLRRRPPWLHLFGHTHQNVVLRLGRTTHVGTCGSRWLGIPRPPAAGV